MRLRHRNAQPRPRCRRGKKLTVPSEKTTLAALSDAFEIHNKPMTMRTAFDLEDDRFVASLDDGDARLVERVKKLYREWEAFSNVRADLTRTLEEPENRAVFARLAEK